MSGETLTALPVFPLGQALFPGMPLTLHIFEERYKTMLRHLRTSENRFVVALIREGVEVGGDAVPHETGCVAEVLHVQPTGGGTFLLRATGGERVQIMNLDRTSQPYLMGLVTALPEDPAPVEHALFHRVSNVFEQYARLLVSLSGEELESVELPSEPLLLSSLIASMLQVPPERKQALLELPGSAARLEAEADMLRVELPILRAMVEGPQPPTDGKSSFSAN